jgi:hypothetical protein
LSAISLVIDSVLLDDVSSVIGLRIVSRAVRPDDHVLQLDLDRLALYRWSLLVTPLSVRSRSG